MWFMNWIIQRFSDASNFFYRIYFETYSWVYPFWLVSDWFLDLCYLFNDLAWDFYYFSEWVDETHSRLRDILSWDTIRSFILGWIPNLEDISYWFYYWWDYVTQAIEYWWYSTSDTVLSWILDAKNWSLAQINTAKATLEALIADTKDWLQAQIDALQLHLTNLQLAWDSFQDRIPSIDEIIVWFSNWGALIIAQIIAWGALTGAQISSLIDSAFTLRDSYWAGWQDIKDSVIEFIPDPQGWFYDRLEEVFDRFW